MRGTIALLLAGCAFDTGGIPSRPDAAAADECALGTDDCDTDADCIDVAQGWECVCRTGFTGDGTSCSPTYAALAVGFRYACAVRGDGTLWCWGANENGQLGNGTEVHAPVPAQVGSESDWTAVAAGFYHTCGLRAPGTLWCWGDNSEGQLTGGGGESRPVQAGSDDDWIAVTAGYQFTCGLRTGGSLWCWGANYYGALGHGTLEASSDPVLVPGGWRAVRAGIYHTCAIDETEVISCWGHNGYGQVGVPGQASFTSPEPVAGLGWTALATGALHTCAVSNGNVWCWGWNGRDQVDGDAGTAVVTEPRLVTGEPHRLVTAGSQHTCATRQDGTSECWGGNQVGQLGDGTRIDRPRPVLVDSTVTFTEIHASWELSTCALDDTGAVWCWGLGGSDELGGGETELRQPTAISAGTGIHAIAAGFDLSCAIDAVDELSCWGSNELGGLGDDSTISREEPAPVAGGATWQAVTAGLGFACGLRASDDTLWCWGRDNLGQSGNGGLGASYVPQEVGLGYAWQSVDAGRQHACGIQGGQGYINCWGYNGSGQLGDFSTVNRDAPTALGTPMGSWRQVSAGVGHSCAVNLNGSLFCWGADSFGQLGRGTPGSPALGPTQVGASLGWTAVAAGGGHTCAVQFARMYCWGDNGSGQLGVGGGVDSSAVPLEVPGGAVWAQVVAGRRHTCALRTDGTLWCWGDAEWGQVGDGGWTTRTTPVPIGDANWIALAIDHDHTCGGQTDGTLWCWGKNGMGQLAAAPWQVSPARVADP